MSAHGLPQNLNVRQGLFVSQQVRKHLAAAHGIEWTENVNYARAHYTGYTQQTLDNVEFAIVRDLERAEEVLTEPGSPYVVVKQTATRIFVRVLA